MKNNATNFDSINERQIPWNKIYQSGHRVMQKISTTLISIKYVRKNIPRRGAWVAQ